MRSGLDQRQAGDEIGFEQGKEAVLTKNHMFVVDHDNPDSTIVYKNRNIRDYVYLDRYWLYTLSNETEKHAEVYED